MLWSVAGELSAPGRLVPPVLSAETLAVHGGDPGRMRTAGTGHIMERPTEPNSEGGSRGVCG